MTTPVQVGLLGLGRSGYGIHAKAAQSLPDLFKVAAVFDPLTDRRNTTAQELSAKPHDSVESLLADGAIDLVVVASPNKFHFPQALQALKANKHVICEKPFGTTVAQVDDMIAAAKAANKILQPFQQRRYEPDFQEVKRLIDSGLFGVVTNIKMHWQSFKRRWDWQTLPEFLGGELYNNGPHPIDHAMILLGDTDATPVHPTVWCERRRVLTSGPAEDFVKIILTAPNKPTVEIELSSNTPFGQDRFLVSGSAGGLRGNPDKLEYKWVDWSALPKRPADPVPTPDRSYNSEKLPWQTATWTATAETGGGGGAAPASLPILSLYRDLYATLRQGKPQVVTPQSVRRRIAIVEECARVAVI